MYMSAKARPLWELSTDLFLPQVPFGFRDGMGRRSRRWRDLSGLGDTQADCGSRGWNGTSCQCPPGQVAQGNGSCLTPAGPVSCSPGELDFTTGNFPQGVCLAENVDFALPANAYLGPCIGSPHGCPPPGGFPVSPLSLITSIYGPLTPGTTGPAPPVLPQRTLSAASGGLDISSLAQSSLSNLSRPSAGLSFQVGDQFQISITNAPPGAHVVIAATQNGKDMGSTSYGQIGADGSFSLTGTLDASTVGFWTEKWTVGGLPVNSVSFTVSAAPSGGGGPGSKTPPPPPPPSGGGGGNGGEPATPGVLTEVLNEIKSAQLFGLPAWEVVLGGGVVVAGIANLFGGRRR